MINNVSETVKETSNPSEDMEKSQQILQEKPVEHELMEKFDTLQQALTTLQKTFDDKIAEDKYKNELFDNMHRELVRYQNGALDKIIDIIALDIIQLIDATKGHVRVYESKESTEENYEKLLRVIKGIAEDLEDILYRQKIIQTVPTDDKSKDNLVAERMTSGYEKGEKVFRPERIKIFKYSDVVDANSIN